MNHKRLSVGERCIAFAGVLLVVDLIALPWHRVSVGAGPFDMRSSRTALESPNGFVGLLILLVAAAVVARILVSELTSVALPALPVSWPQADLIGAVAVAGLVMLKLLLESSYISVGAWAAIPLASVMLLGGYLQVEEAAAEYDREMRARLR